MLDKRRLCGAASWSGAPVHLVEAPVYSYAVGTGKWHASCCDDVQLERERLRAMYGQTTSF